MSITEDVAALLDTPGPQPSVPAAVAQITVMARAYTRGRGFDYDGPNEELAAVITTAAARLAANGAQTQSTNTAGHRSIELRSSFIGWSLAELAVLNRYRVTAM